MPIWPGASSVASNSASASPISDRPRSRSPARAASDAQVAQRHADASAVAELAAQRQRLLEPGRGRARARPVAPARVPSRFSANAVPIGSRGVAEVGQALVQALARRLAEPLGARDVAERGEDVADRAPTRPRGERTARSPRSTSGAPPPVRLRRRRGPRCGPGRSGRDRPRASRATGSGCRSSASRAPAKSPRHWASTPTECGTAAEHLAIAELLGQRAALGVEVLGAVVATRHVLIDPGLVERVGDGAPVAQRPEDRDPLGAELAEPARPPEADLEPARRAQRLRAELGRRRGRRERRGEPAAALLEVTARPSTSATCGRPASMPARVRAAAPRRAPRAGCRGRPRGGRARRAARLPRPRDRPRWASSREKARWRASTVIASPASARRSRAYWRIGSSSR